MLLHLLLICQTHQIRGQDLDGQHRPCCPWKRGPWRRPRKAFRGLTFGRMTCGGGGMHWNANGRLPPGSWCLISLPSLVFIKPRQNDQGPEILCPRFSTTQSLARCGLSAPRGLRSRLRPVALPYPASPSSLPGCGGERTGKCSGAWAPNEWANQRVTRVRGLVKL